MRLAISGRGQSGKDTAAEWLRDNTTLRYCGSTSRIALPVVFRAFLRRYGASYVSPLACYADRLNHRQFWSDVIDKYNTPDACRLYRDCLEVQDILTGIRKRRELEAVKKAGLIDLSVWIGRDNTEDETQEYGPEDCDIALYNNGTLEQFYEKLHRLAASWGILKESA